MVLWSRPVVFVIASLTDADQVTFIILSLQDDSLSDSDSDGDTSSIIGPLLSPISTVPFDDANSIASDPIDASTFLDVSHDMPLFSPVDTNENVVTDETDQHETLAETPIPHDADSDRLPSHPVNFNVSDEKETTAVTSGPCLEEGTSTSSIIVWNGFKLVGDNIDKNYRRSFHRINRNTTLIHYFHHYAVLDCIDLSGCSDALPTKPIDVEKLMIDIDDLAMLNDEVIVLISR